VWPHEYDAPPEAVTSLFVIQVNVVFGDVGQVVRSKVELRRIDVFAAGALPGEIQIGREILCGVAAAQFHAVLLAEGVVEGPSE